MDYEIAMCFRHTEIWAGYCCSLKYKTLLEVSTLGRRRITDLKTFKVEKCDYGTSDTGYKKFGTYGKAHRCIAQVFIPSILTINNWLEAQVNHIDGNKSNNTINNLEWLTPSEHLEHTKSLGVLNKGKGINHFNYGRKASTSLKEKLSSMRKGKLNSRYDDRIHIFKNVYDNNFVQGTFLYLKNNSLELFGFSKGYVSKLKLNPHLISKSGWTYKGIVENTDLDEDNE